MAENFDLKFAGMGSEFADTGRERDTFNLWGGGA